MCRRWPREGGGVANLCDRLLQAIHRMLHDGIGHDVGIRVGSLVTQMNETEGPLRKLVHSRHHKPHARLTLAAGRRRLKMASSRAWEKASTSSKHDAMMSTM